MTRAIIWSQIPRNAMRQAVVGEANRFRVWQAVRVLGIEATSEEIQDFVRLERTAVNEHLRSLGVKLAPVRKAAPLFELPIDEFIARPSDGLGLGDVVH
jgi:hypothetical protein